MQECCEGSMGWMQLTRRIEGWGVKLIQRLVLSCTHEFTLLLNLFARTGEIGRRCRSLCVCC